MKEKYESYYLILGLNCEAKLRDINIAIQRQTRKESDPIRLEKIKKAAAVLIDETQKGKYDKLLTSYTAVADPIAPDANNPVKSYYIRLGVHPESKPEEIISAYEKIISSIHLSISNEEILIDLIRYRVDIAYRILSDSNKRKIYDDILSNDLYRRLGVSKTATQQEIAQAGQRLSSCLNSESESDPTIEKNRKQALTVLSDDQKRRIYDQMNLSNYYDRMGLKKTATDDEIKKAYRELALKVHPDKFISDFPFPQKKLGEAHDTLSDPGKRNEYDKSIDQTTTLSLDKEDEVPFDATQQKKYLTKKEKDQWITIIAPGLSHLNNVRSLLPLGRRWRAATDEGVFRWHTLNRAYNCV